MAEESSFFEAKFRSPEFSGADGSIELRDIDGATLASSRPDALPTLILTLTLPLS